eukprot:1108694-Pyramimonas_sp.AAC.1
MGWWGYAKRKEFGSAAATHYAVPPKQPSKVATVSQIAAPQGWRGLIWACGGYPLYCPPHAALESRDGFANRSPPRDSE